MKQTTLYAHMALVLITVHDKIYLFLGTKQSSKTLASLPLFVEMWKNSETAFGMEP